MTHTLHRRGSKEELQQEFVVLAMAARGVNREGAAPKLARALEIFARHNPVNFGNVEGNSLTADAAALVSKTRDNTVSHAVFRSEADLAAVLEDLKKEDLGISIVVSGLFEEVRKCCCRTHLTPHTSNVSLGVFGRIDKLPREEVLEISTMCGHNMISASLIQYQTDLIRRGITTPEAAARKIAASCHCGVFNWERAARVFERLAKE